jgi:hypothetical protein
MNIVIPCTYDDALPFFEGRALVLNYSDSGRKEFFIDIPIKFKHEYKISPHISFYITPLSNTLDECVIHEITTKEVVFRIKYGNRIKNVGKTDQFKNDIYSGLKLHYNINGVVEQNENLLD